MLSMEIENEICVIKNDFSNSVSSVEEFDKICRLCLSAENTICFIFELQYSGNNFSDILHSCTSIHVEKDDKLPKNICYDCIKKVIEFNDFKSQCTLSESTLKNVLLQKDLVNNKSNETEDIITDQQEIKETILPDEDTECNDDIFQDANTENSDDDIKETVKKEKDKKSITKVPACRKCDKSFESWEELKEHRQKENHWLRKNRICKYCNKSILHGHILEHYRVHTKEKPFQCSICSVRFSLKSNMNRHMKIHTGDRPHKCDICGKAFIQTTSLKDHMRTHTGEKIYVCSHCGKSFAYSISYKSHLITAHPSETDDGKQIQQIKKQRTSVQIQKKMQCDTCQKIFSSRGALRTHQLTHGEKNFLCSDCGKSFYSPAGLQSHLKVHTGEKPHQCTTCQKSFSQISTLKSHILTHTGQKPFVCKVCSKAFTQRNHLRYHMRTHSGERPYMCSYCGKSFSLKGTLTVHVRTHTGETPYVCDVCGKGFYDSSSMKKHKKSHSVDNN